MKDVEKTYKQLVIMLKGDIKRLEIDLEKQTFYKDVVDECKIKDTKRKIELIRLEIDILEKQIPKKIFRHPWNGIEGVPYDLCPSCETNLCTNGMFPRKKMNYCEKCGQRLDWN